MVETAWAQMRHISKMKLARQWEWTLQINTEVQKEQIRALCGSFPIQNSLLSNEAAHCLPAPWPLCPLLFSMWIYGFSLAKRVEGWAFTVAKKPLLMFLHSLLCPQSKAILPERIGEWGREQKVGCSDPPPCLGRNLSFSPESASITGKLN